MTHAHTNSARTHLPLLVVLLVGALDRLERVVGRKEEADHVAVSCVGVHVYVSTARHATERERERRICGAYAYTPRPDHHPPTPPKTKRTRGSPRRWRRGERGIPRRRARTPCTPSAPVGVLGWGVRVGWSYLGVVWGGRRHRKHDTPRRTNTHRHTHPSPHRTAPIHCCHPHTRQLLLPPPTLVFSSSAPSAGYLSRRARSFESCSLIWSAMVVGLGAVVAGGGLSWDVCEWRGGGGVGLVSVVCIASEANRNNRCAAPASRALLLWPPRPPPPVLRQQGGGAPQHQQRPQRPPIACESALVPPARAGPTRVRASRSPAVGACVLLVSWLGPSPAAAAARCCSAAAPAAATHIQYSAVVASDAGAWRGRPRPSSARAPSIAARAYCAWRWRRGRTGVGHGRSAPPPHFDSFERRQDEGARLKEGARARRSSVPIREQRLGVEDGPRVTALLLPEHARLSNHCSPSMNELSPRGRGTIDSIDRMPLGRFHQHSVSISGVPQTNTILDRRFPQQRLGGYLRSSFDLRSSFVRCSSSSSSQEPAAQHCNRIPSKWRRRRPRPHGLLHPRSQAPAPAPQGARPAA